MNKIMSSEEIAKEYDGVLYNNKWVDKEELLKAMSLVNKKLFNDEFGSYDWNELLLDILEERVDEE